MLLTITLTQSPATDLGFLLHKNPARTQTFELSFGQAHVFYSEARPDCCTAALLLDVDPIALVRDRRGPAGENQSLEQYVNDRPYVASSFLSVAIAQVFGSALNGHSKDRQELADTALPFRACLTALPCRGGEALLRQLFEPLGYQLTVRGQLLDETFPDWGDSRYFHVELAATCRLAELLTHLYVLIPVLDDDKHYWVSADEVEKLLRHGEGWLSAHPCRDLITRRYLKHQKSLMSQALARLVEEDTPDPDQAEEQEQQETAVEQPARLNEQRLGTVLTLLRDSGARRLLDLGCGGGQLLRLLLAEPTFTEIVGVDVSHRALEVASGRLRLERLPDRQRERVKLLHGALTYRDHRLAGYDAAAVVEVIEHLDPPRLDTFERVLFEFARPTTVVLTTPNVEYNVKFENLPAGQRRHRDHRFEWTRAEFRAWAERVAGSFGYAVRFLPVGPEDPLLGPPTQVAVFRRPEERTP